MNKPHLRRAFLYFGISLILTSLFLLGSPYRVTETQFTLTLSMLAGVWVIQVFLALTLLNRRSASFIHGMGRVCLMGCLFLAPYIFSSWLEISDDPSFFFGSLVLAMLIMIFRYHAEVTRLNLSFGWWYFWLFTLVATAGLEFTLVFHLL